MRLHLLILESLKDMPFAFQQHVHARPQDMPIQELLLRGDFRGAAQAATTKLLNQTHPSDHHAIFELLYVRFVCLMLLDYHLEAAQEAKAVQDFDGPYFRDAHTGVHLMPWELRLIIVRLQAISVGDWRRGIITYFEMARECRWYLARSPDQQEKQLWIQRLIDLGLCVTHALVELGDPDGAARHLKAIQRDAETNKTAVSLRIALLYLHVGDLTAVREYLAGDEETTNISSIIRALVLMAVGQYEEAVELFRKVETDVGGEQELKKVAMQNKAACLVYLGQISEVWLSTPAMLANNY